MITGNDFINTMGIFGFLVYLFRKIIESKPLSPFTLRFLELNDYEKLIMTNDTKDNLNITVRNDDTEKAIYLRYGQDYDVKDVNLTPGRQFDIALMPEQSLLGRTYWGTAQISVLVQ